MKQKLLPGLLALAIAPAVLSQTPPIYENYGVVQCPPEIPPTIDAFNFVNHAQFIINFTNGFLQGVPINSPPYETSSTINYTNDFGALMSCNTGFRLEDYSLQLGQRQRAGTVYNNGTMECGTLGSSNTIIFGGAFFAISGSAAGISTKINATNFVNPGSINMGFDSLLSIKAENVDVTHGNLNMENTGFSVSSLALFFSGGFFDGYWGLSFINTNFDFRVDPTIFEATPPFSQFFLVTNRAYQVLYPVQMGGPSFVPYLLDVTDSTQSNRTVRAVFLSNTNPLITPKVFFASAGDPFDLGPDIIQWSWVYTNANGITTNFMYLEDSYLEFTNHQLLINGFAGVGINRPTFIPENYTFFRSGTPFFLGGNATPTAIPPGTFIPGLVTNQWVAYQALFLPGSTVPSDTAGGNVTNMPGRIELTADKYMKLPQAQINSASYVLLKATNQFGGSAGAQIQAPFADLYLRSTNGTLTISNVLVPFLERPLGICDLYSARWTNVVNISTGTTTNTVTNRFHVLFVDTQLATTSPLTVQTLNLTATNGITHASDDSIIISDVFNVSSNLLLNTLRLTLATNSAGSPEPAGMINYLNPAILWPTATPRLRYLTNNGGFTAPNLVVFGGSQSTPYSSPSSSMNPYAAFVNTGGVTNFASSIFSTYFQNSGTFMANGGAIQLRQAQSAILTNGAFLAPGSAGTILIQGGSLFASNHVLKAGNSLTFSLTDRLDDGSVGVGSDAVTNRNIWYAGYGINLPVLPTTSSLLATTITNIGPPGALVYNTWAGQDLGPVAAGFANNAAVGRLILDGLTNTTQFWFLPAAGSNALYVDYLEFRDYMTNFDKSGNLANLFFAPGMKIYYAQLIVNGNSFAEKLNGKNGGGLNWVPGYAGTFSSTNLIYPDGTTNRLNLALVQSCDIDSNGNGIPNCMDPAPVPIAAQFALAAALMQKTNVVLTWTGVPFKRNYLEYKTSLKTATWQPLTNFLVPGPGSGQLRVVEPAGPGSRCYRVRVAP
jgi:hypothetical protein